MGKATELTANTITQSMYAQCDDQCNEYLLLDSFVNYRKNDNVMKLADQKSVHKGREYMKKQSTKGWEICCEWKDGPTRWEEVSNRKESHPALTVEYAISHEIAHEHASNWWMYHVLKKRDRIIALVGHPSPMKSHHKCQMMVVAVLVVGVGAAAGVGGVGAGVGGLVGLPVGLSVGAAVVLSGFIIKKSTL